MTNEAHEHECDRCTKPFECECMFPDRHRHKPDRQPLRTNACGAPGCGTPTCPSCFKRYVLRSQKEVQVSVVAAIRTAVGVPL